MLDLKKPRDLSLNGLRSVTFFFFKLVDVFFECSRKVLEKTPNRMKSVIVIKSGVVFAINSKGVVVFT